MNVSNGFGYWFENFPVDLLAVPSILLTTSIMARVKPDDPRPPCVPAGTVMPKVLCEENFLKTVFSDSQVWKLISPMIELWHDPPE